MARIACLRRIVRKPYLIAAAQKRSIEFLIIAHAVVNHRRITGRLYHFAKRYGIAGNLTFAQMIGSIVGLPVFHIIGNRKIKRVALDLLQYERSLLARLFLRNRL